MKILSDEELERAKTVTAVCASLAHLVDIEGFIETAELFASPHAVIAGHSPMAVDRAQGWAEMGRGLKIIRDAAVGQNELAPDVRAAIEKRFENFLKGQDF